MSDNEFLQKMNKYAVEKESRIENCEPNESQTRVTLIDPYLRDVLSWDPEDPTQVRHEYRAAPSTGTIHGRNRVDYALFIDGKPKVFIEAKRAGYDLGNGEATLELINYVLHNEWVNYAAFTNGVRWLWFKKILVGTFKLTPFLDCDVMKPERMEGREVRCLKALSRSIINESASIIDEEIMRRLFEKWLDKTLKNPPDELLKTFIRDVKNNDFIQNLKPKQILEMARKISRHQEPLIDDRNDIQIRHPKPIGYPKWRWKRNRSSDWQTCKSGAALTMAIARHCLDNRIHWPAIKDEGADGYIEIEGHPGKFIRTHMGKDARIAQIKKVKNRLLPKLQVEISERGDDWRSI